MAISEVIAHVDAEILKLQQVRAMLLGGSTATSKAGRGRPKGSKNTTAPVSAKAASAPAKTKRKLSPEGRKAIAEAMKRRWAERRKTAAK